MTLWLPFISMHDNVLLSNVQLQVSPPLQGISLRSHMMASRCMPYSAPTATACTVGWFVSLGYSASMVVWWLWWHFISKDQAHKQGGLVPVSWVWDAQGQAGHLMYMLWLLAHLPCLCRGVKSKHSCDILNLPGPQGWKSKLYAKRRLHIISVVVGCSVQIPKVTSYLGSK